MVETNFEMEVLRHNSFVVKVKGYELEERGSVPGNGEFLLIATIVPIQISR